MLIQVFLEIVRFREMLEERLSGKELPLSVVSDEHKPVIAKLVHERCVAPLVAFACVHTCIL